MQLPQTAALALAGPSEVPFTDGGRAWFHSFDQEGNPITVPLLKDAVRAILFTDSSHAFAIVIFICLDM